MDTRAHHSVKTTAHRVQRVIVSFVAQLNSLCFLLVFTTTVARDSSNIHRFRASSKQKPTSMTFSLTSSGTRVSWPQTRVFAVGRDGPDQLNNRATHRSQNGGRKFGLLGDVGDDDKVHSSSLVLIGDLSAGRGVGGGMLCVKLGLKITFSFGVGRWKCCGGVFVFTNSHHAGRDV